MRHYVLGGPPPAAEACLLLACLAAGSRSLLVRVRHAGCVSDIIGIIVRPASVLAQRLITPPCARSLGGSRSHTPRFATPPLNGSWRR